MQAADSIKRFSYLLGQTDLFQHFCDLKAQRDPEFAKLLDESQKVLSEKATKGKGAKCAPSTCLGNLSANMRAGATADTDVLRRKRTPNC